MSAATATFDSPPRAVVAAVKPAVNPWIIALVVTLATFMEILDTSIANVSLPHIAGGLGTDQTEATWVLTSYLVANAVVLPLSAWLSRVFGRKNFYMTCVALFTIASFLCGLAPNIGMLIFFRVLQGMGGGGLAPSEQAILVDTFPPAKRAAAFALYSMAIVMAPAIGPTLGGYITDNYSWRWVFFINIPVGIISLLLSSALIKDPPAFVEEMREARLKGKLRIDYLGILLVGMGLGCLEVVLDKGQEDDWLSSPFIVTFLTVAVVSLILAVVWELNHDDPVVEIAMLKERNFAIACGLYLLLGVSLFGTTVLIPQMLQSLYGFTATQAGEALGPGALVVVVAAPFVVKLAPKIGASRMVALGFFIVAMTLFHYNGFTLAADYKHFVLTRMVQGLGIAMLFVPITQIAYSYLPPNKNNKASSMTNLFRNQGGSFGIAFATTMLSRRVQFHTNVLASHITTGNPAYQNYMQSVRGTLTHAGLSPYAAAVRARALLGQALGQQVTTLAYLDCFWLLAVVALGGIVLAVFVKPFRPVKAGGGAH